MQAVFPPPATQVLNDALIDLGLFTPTKELGGLPGSGKRNVKIRTQFWAVHQRFFRQMLMAAKVQRCAQLALDRIRQGFCVVIGLQSTGALALLVATLSQ